MSEPINFAELDMMAKVVREEGTSPDGRWAAYAGRVLGLPAWFDMTLDPDAAPYRAQQVRLWQAIAGTQGGTMHCGTSRPRRSETSTRCASRHSMRGATRPR